MMVSLRTHHVTWSSIQYTGRESLKCPVGGFPDGRQEGGDSGHRLETLLSRVSSNILTA